MTQPQSPEALAEQSILVDKVDGISVVTLAEPSLREHLASIVGNRLLETAHHCGGMMILKHDLVREFSSAWINELLGLTVHCSGLGGHLICTGMNPNGIQILRTTGLDKRLNLADHEASAREMFALRLRDDGAFVLSWLFGKPRQPKSAAA